MFFGGLEGYPFFECSGSIKLRCQSGWFGDQMRKLSKGVFLVALDKTNIAFFEKRNTALRIRTEVLEGEMRTWAYSTSINNIVHSTMYLSLERVQLQDRTTRQTHSSFPNSQLQIRPSAQATAQSYSGSVRQKLVKYQPFCFL